MTKVGEGVVPISADFGPFDKEVKGQESKMDSKFKKLGGLAVTAFAAAGALAGTAFVSSFSTALGNEKLNDKLAAQLNLTSAESEKYGKVAGDLYADAYGGSMAEVNDAVGAVVSTLGKLDSGDVEALSATALDLAAAFDVDVTEAVSSANIMIKNGLAKDATEAFDIITAGMQTVPAAMRDEIFPIMDEYGVHFDTLGLSGEEAMAIIANASEGGSIALDKTADALKELTIRGTDMSATSVAAYDAMGMSAEEMSNRLLAGGDTATGAFEDIVAGLLAIEDPTERANAAIGLFGTPLEDLSVGEIPAFLEGLQGIDGGLGDVAGRAAEMGDTLNDNVGTKMESFKREALQKLSEFMVNTVIPAVEDLVTAFKGISSWVTDNKEPIIAFTVVVGAPLVAMFAAWAVAAAAAAVSTLLAIAPIVLLGLAAAALVLGIMYLWENWDQIWTWIKDKVGQVWDWIKEKLNTTWTWIKDTASAVFNGIKEFLAGIWNSVSTKVREIWDAIKLKISTTWDSIKTKVTDTVTAVRNKLSEIWDGIKAKVTAVWDGVKTKISDVWNGIKTLVTDRVTAVKNTLSGVWDSIKTKVSDVWNGIKSTVSSVWDGITSKIRSAVNIAIDLINGITGGVNVVLRFLGLSEIAKIAKLAGPAAAAASSGGAMKAFHSGGVVGKDGSPTDGRVGPNELIAKLLKGEEVLTEDDPRHVKNLGMPNTDWVLPIGGPFDFVGEAIKKGTDWVGDRVNQLRGLIAKTARPLVEAAMRGISSAMGPFGGFGNMAGALARKVGNGALDWIAGADKEAAKAGEDALGSKAVGSGYRALLEIFRKSGAPGVVTSTLRSGAGKSKHNVGKAADFSVGGHGNRGYGDPGLRAIFNAFLPHAANLSELILAGAPFNIKNGKRVGGYAWGRPGQPGNHWNHVHAATFDSGGTLAPGWNSVYNDTGAPEPLVPAGNEPQIVRLDDDQLRDLARTMVQMARVR